MGLRDVEASLPPGFRFHPSDEELVCHYLFKKVANEQALSGTLVEIDLHTCEPWQLPEVAKLNTHEWYFFSFRDRKYATGFRTNRATASGYWKATGKDRMIHDPRTRSIVGMRKTLVFYQNRAPNGNKTGWIMHEFRLENPNMPPKEDWVLCRVFYKSRVGENNSNIDIATSPFSNRTMLPSIDLTNPLELKSSLCQLSYLQDESNTGIVGEIVDSKCEDEHGYLFGSGFNESSSGYLNDHNLGGMRFAFEDYC